MKQLGTTFLSVFLMASSAPRPPQLLTVFPEDKSTQTSVQFVGAALNFKLGQEADTSSVKLYVNEIDVTKQARISGTRDVPQSYYKISYTLNSSQSGIHRAAISFRTKDDTIKSYSWSFTIKSP